MVKVSQWTVFGGLVVLGAAIFFSGYYFAKSQNAKAEAQNVAGVADTAQEAVPTANLAAIPEIAETDHIRGNKEAEVMLVEYSDYECPYCKQFHPTMVQLTEEYGDKIGWVFRHYPLPFHPKAQKSAEAAECVAKLAGNEAFWEFTDLVYEKMPDVELTELAAAAAEAGANRAAVQACIDSGEMAQKVTEQMNAGSAFGVNGTPNTVIIGKNGYREMIPGALPYDQVKLAVDRAM